MRRSFLLVLVLASCAAACGGSSQAVKTAPTLAPADPRAARVYLEGASLLARSRDASSQARQTSEGDRAIAKFQEALAIDPQLWEAEYNWGVVLRRRGEARKALPHFERAHQIAKGAGEPIVALAETRYALGETDDAIDLLQAYVQARPDALEVRLALTSLLREAKQYDDALAQAREVLLRNAGNVRALLEVARIYRAKGELDTAELVLQKVLALDAKSAAAHNDLGLLALARGDTQLSFQHFEQAVELDAAFLPARLNRASVLLRAGDYAGAKAEYDKVLAAASDSLDARVGLGVSLRGLGKHRDAEAEYEKVLSSSPNHAAALFDLGVLRAEFLDRRSEARALFAHYLEVAADDDLHREKAERYLEEIPAPAAAAAPAPAAKTGGAP